MKYHEALKLNQYLKDELLGISKNADNEQVTMKVEEKKLEPIIRKTVSGSGKIVNNTCQAHHDFFSGRPTLPTNDNAGRDSFWGFLD